MIRKRITARPPRSRPPPRGKPTSAAAAASAAMDSWVARSRARRADSGRDPAAVSAAAAREAAAQLQQAATGASLVVPDSVAPALLESAGKEEEEDEEGAGGVEERKEAATGLHAVRARVVAARAAVRAAAAGVAVEEGGQDSLPAPRQSAQVLSAFVLSKERLGCAVLDVDSQQLRMTELFVWPHDTADTLQQLRLHTLPTTVLLPSSAPEEWADMLTAPLPTGMLPEGGQGRAVEERKHSGGGGGGGDDDDDDDGGDGAGEHDSTAPDLRVLRERDFAYEAACSTLAAVLCPGGGSLAEQQTALAAAVDVSNRQMLRAAGAVLKFAAREGFAARRQAAVRSVSVFQLSDYMAVDLVTLRALQVFARDAHPSVVKGAGRAKEGFSLFALLDRTASVLGKRLLRAWMLKPTVARQELTARQDAIQLLLTGEGAELLPRLRRHLRGVRDIPRLLRRIRTVTASAADWCSLYDSVVHALQARAVLSAWSRRHTGRLVGSRLAVLLSAVATDVSLLHSLMAQVLDMAASRESGSLTVKPGVDDALDAARAQYAALEGQLLQEAQALLAAAPQLASVAVKYMPQVGFVIVLSAAQRMDELPPGLDLQFTARDSRYFKNDRMRHLDLTLGDVHGIMCDMERGIVRQLEAQLLLREVALLEAADALAQADALISLATAARDYGLRRPTLVEDNVLLIRGGRHPLQELLVETFIPNDTALTPDSDGGGGCAVVTGPNFSGKSVYLRQVGLIAYMAHVGSFVPAEEAVIGPVDAILTRIASFDSVSLAMSSFGIDAAQVGGMLRRASARSLLLLDEFGKGTNSVDGAALQAAVLLALASGQQTDGRCPKVIASTHFHELFSSGVLDAGQPQIRLFQMEVLLADARGELTAAAGSTAAAALAGGGLLPLFRLVPGHASASHGLACAVRAALPQPVVDRAAEVLRLLASGQRIDALRTAEAATAAAEDDALLAAFSAAAWGEQEDVSHQLAALKALIATV
eukprot:PLAT2488.1.p1 GENE.PLAT2488.1~~PLAT2488.1.p1  ORF type:complete len:990 (-),score=501.39 PLAT2488.1:266-3235(-)